jgi:hypothetical protein
MSNRNAYIAVTCLGALAALPLSTTAPIAQADSVRSLGYMSPRGSTSCVSFCGSEPSNPHIINVPQPDSAEAQAWADARERRWVERCRPVIRQDEYGVPRYIYAARGCEYGRLD